MAESQGSQPDVDFSAGREQSGKDSHWFAKFVGAGLEFIAGLAIVATTIVTCTVGSAWLALAYFVLVLFVFLFYLESKQQPEVLQRVDS